MTKPAVDKLLEKVPSKYALVMAIAKRAKQLTDKRERFLRESEVNPVYAAMDEIATDKVIVKLDKVDEEDDASLNGNES